jgi:TPR repeat protein
MKPDITPSRCWPAAYELIANDELEKVVAAYESEQCEITLECKKFLGWTYYKNGNFEAALKWFEKAIEQGNGEAMFGIGSVYFARNEFVDAVQYFEQAENRGYGRACHWLGKMYRHGLGVPRSDSAAIKWYKRGAAQGYLFAERALMHLICERGGVVARICTFPKYIYLLAKAGVIAFRNIHDQRLVDIPNVLIRNNESVR